MKRQKLRGYFRESRFRRCLGLLFGLKPRRLLRLLPVKLYLGRFQLSGHFLGRYEDVHANGVAFADAVTAMRPPQVGPPRFPELPTPAFLLTDFRGRQPGSHPTAFIGPALARILPPRLRTK